MKFKPDRKIFLRDCKGGDLLTNAEVSRWLALPRRKRDAVCRVVRELTTEQRNNMTAEQCATALRGAIKTNGPVFLSRRFADEVRTVLGDGLTEQQTRGTE